MSYQNVPSSATLTPQQLVDPGIDGTYDDKRGFAWKYFGYPELSKWMAASRDAFVLRRFSAVSARTLLYIQHEIAQREQKLQILDEQSMLQPEDKGGCDSFQTDVNTERGRIIMMELPPLLEQYYSLVNSFTQVRSIPTARNEHIQNLQNWIASFPDAITRKEQYLFDLEQRGDMFPIVSRPKVPLRRFLESSRLLRRLFRVKDRPDRVTELDAVNYSETGLDNLSNILAILMGLGLLFGPMWWLHWVDKDLPRLGVITVAILLFSAWLYIAGATRSFEILGGTAAYAAVLMVYMQTGGSGSSSGV